MRVAVLGGFAFVLFAIIFFRLWFLQVLTGDDYVSQARDNRIRKVKIEAPRGNIVDRNGRTLVKTRAAPVVQILPTASPTPSSRSPTIPQGARRRRGRAASPPRRTCARSSGGCAPTGASHARPRSAGAPRSTRQLERAERVPIPRSRPASRELRALYDRLGEVIDLAPRRSTGASSRGSPTSRRRT